MLDSARQRRNGDRLSECHPAFRAALRRVLHDLEADHYRPRIQCAWRSPAAQAEAYAEGRTHVKWSYHNATTPDGHPDALAADILDDDAPLAPSRRYLLVLAMICDRYGLSTGITWGLDLDPETGKRTPGEPMTRAVRMAIATRNADADVKIGWDPCHVEIRGLTLAQAKAGQRPIGGMYA